MVIIWVIIGLVYVVLLSCMLFVLGVSCFVSFDRGVDVLRLCCLMMCMGLLTYVFIVCCVEWFIARVAL